MADIFLFKGIKPKRLSSDAIWLELLNALRKEGRIQQRELRKTVSTWRNKPTFEFVIGIAKDGVRVATGPGGNKDAAQHWVWTNDGTKPHAIVARRAPRLRFQTGFVPKTRHGQFKSYRGRRFGPWTSPRAVWHPGTEARNWTEILQKRRKRPFTRAMIKAIQRGARKMAK